MKLKSLEQAKKGFVNLRANYLNYKFELWLMAIAKYSLLGLFLVLVIFAASGCVQQKKAGSSTPSAHSMCEWSAIAAKYAEGSCSGSIRNGQVSISLRGFSTAGYS
ncbi:MAG: hypothetical protein QXS37_03910 [Candidatus Aenigmatarchaeota archaeon]